MGRGGTPAGHNSEVFDKASCKVQFRLKGTH